jgi:response regulator RpfG family c-di-GMP phosphodiesterase
MIDKERSKILVCDDAVTNVLILSELLKNEINADVHSETDPRKVLNTIQETEFDLLILDIEMPHLSGIQVLKQVRAIFDENQLPVIILTGNQSKKVREKALIYGANDFITKPFDQLEVVLRTKSILKISQAFKNQQQINKLLEEKVQHRTSELMDATKALLHRLAIAGEMKDNETGQHVIRVGKYAQLFSGKIGLPDNICHMIGKTVPLHDIGKIGIPDSILLKPGKLDDSQREVMKTHTVLGAKILGNHPSLLIQMAKTISLSHHEKWDGTGYPQGLKGESIPIEGRITALSDVFDALCSKRPYKKAWPMDKVINYIREEAGNSFDPNLVDIFLNNQNDFIQIQQQNPDLSDA